MPLLLLGIAGIAVYVLWKKEPGSGIGLPTIVKPTVVVTRTEEQTKP